MSKIHLIHIQSVIKKLFDQKIDLSDLDIVKSIKESDKENAFLTRGLAAFSLYTLAGIDEVLASKAIVDSFNDNGIDAIYFDKNSKNLWIVQSKWIKSATGSPELGEVKKFRDGIRELIDLDFRKFNQKICNLQGEIENALTDHEVGLNIVIAFTGDCLATHSQREIDDLLKELNDPTETTQFFSFNLYEAHKSLAGSTSGQPIDFDIHLMNWGCISEPIQAIYGTVCASDIVTWWNTYHRRLFNENIRSFIGSNDINISIQETLRNEPQYFWYFNNGVTLLCKNISKAPLGGSEKAIGIFHCTGISIVNGAQTVGNIGEVKKRGNDVDKAHVLVRLISLDAAPEKFGQRITKAANTQNRIEKRDFVTQDSQQQRLFLELSLLGKKYHYIRTDEVTTLDDDNCTLEEATIALACSQKDIDFSILAKRELGKLWDDIGDNTKPYRILFNDSISGSKVWRFIKISREISSQLKLYEERNNGRKRSLYIHGNRFFLHIIFCLLADKIFEPDYDISNEEKNISKFVEVIGEITWSIIESDYPSSMIHQIFRNYTKSRDIKEKVLSSL